MLCLNLGLTYPCLVELRLERLVCAIKSSLIQWAKALLKCRCLLLEVALSLIIRDPFLGLVLVLLISHGCDAWDRARCSAARTSFWRWRLPSRVGQSVLGARLHALRFGEEGLRHTQRPREPLKRGQNHFPSAVIVLQHLVNTRVNLLIVVFSCCSRLEHVVGRRPRPPRDDAESQMPAFSTWTVDYGAGHHLLGVSKKFWSSRSLPFRAVTTAACSLAVRSGYLMEVCGSKKQGRLCCFLLRFVVLRRDLFFVVVVSRLYVLLILSNDNVHTSK